MVAMNFGDLANLGLAIFTTHRIQLNVGKKTIEIVGESEHIFYVRFFDFLPFFRYAATKT